MMKIESDQSGNSSPAFVKVDSQVKIDSPTEQTLDSASDIESQDKEEDSNYTGNTIQLQVIDENQNFSEELTHYMKDVWRLSDLGFNYNLVAVFGSQSTGKSTLLNALFKTRFDTMGETYRQQTTKGLWVSLAKDSNTLVMDVEGVDGRERGEDQDFERKSALFSLAVSQVVIVNLWENQIGLYNGANMGLLKTVFEVNLELFQQKGKGKTLLFFVIRDHIGKVPLSHLSETLKQDLQRCWNELSKPKGLEGSNITDFFDFMFFGLPHKVLLPDEFDEQVQILRQCFYDSSHPNYVFRPQYHKRIPADGFKVYAENIWEQIITNKNLDLPTQKELLAQFRCDEISTSVYSELVKDFAPTRDDIDGSVIVSDLGDTFKNLKAKALERFDNEAGRYLKDVYLKKRQDLETKIFDYFHTYFKAQLDGLAQSIYAEFSSTIDLGLKQKNYDFVQLTTAAANEAKEEFAKQAKAIILEGSEWSFAKERHSLESDIKHLIVAKRQAELSNLEQSFMNEISNQFYESLPPLFNSAKPDLWSNVLNHFMEATKEASEKLKERSIVFELDPHETQKHVGNFHVKSWENLQKHIRDEVQDAMLLTKLRNKLEEKFRYDQDGLPRVWKPEDDIDSYFKDARNSALELLPLLSKIEFNNAFDPPAYFEGATNDIDFQRSLSVISPSKQNEIETRFKREADALFLEAKRSIVATTTSIPYWVIAVMLLLGWNEILYVLGSPFSFLMIIFGGVAFYAIWTLKLIGPVSKVIEVTSREIYQQLRKVLEESVKGSQSQTEIPMRPLSSNNSSKPDSSFESNIEPNPSQNDILGSQSSSNSSRARTSTRSSLKDLGGMPGSVDFDD